MGHRIERERIGAVVVHQIHPSRANRRPQKLFGKCDLRSDPELFLQAPFQPEPKILDPGREGSRAVPKCREHGRELRLR